MSDDEGKDSNGQNMQHLSYTNLNIVI